MGGAYRNWRERRHGGWGRRGSPGFTLLEVLIVLVLFTVITAIVYACFSTVVNSAEMVREDVERLRMQEYLVRSFTTNLSTVFTDLLYEDTNFMFIGRDYEDQDGPADSLTFVATAPLIGGFSLPGDVKLVTYEIPIQNDDMFLQEDRPRLTVPDGVDLSDEAVDTGRKLVISETPMMTGNTHSMHSTSEEGNDFFPSSDATDSRNGGRDGFEMGGIGDSEYQNSADAEQRRQEAERRREERSKPRPSDYLNEDGTEDEQPVTSKAMFQTPYVELGVRTLDIEYFDGEEWVKEWNSSAYDSQDPEDPEAMGRLPWAVRIRINFEKTEEELDEDRQAGLNEDEDVDFEMVVPVRQGEGITQHVYEVPELQNLVPGYTGTGATGQIPNSNGSNGSNNSNNSNNSGDSNSNSTRGSISGGSGSYGTRGS